MDYRIFATVQNGPETLMRVTGLLRRKGYKMKKISMTERQDLSGAHLMITVEEQRSEVERMMNEMEKLIDVQEVNALGQFEDRELKNVIEYPAITHWEEDTIPVSN